MLAGMKKFLVFLIVAGALGFLVKWMMDES